MKTNLKRLTRKLAICKRLAREYHAKRMFKTWSFYMRAAKQLKEELSLECALVHTRLGVEGKIQARLPARISGLVHRIATQEI